MQSSGSGFVSRATFAPVDGAKTPRPALRNDHEEVVTARRFGLGRQHPGGVAIDLYQASRDLHARADVPTNPNFYTEVGRGTTKKRT
jgi:hypothetical protein